MARLAHCKSKYCALSSTASMPDALVISTAAAFPSCSASPGVPCHRAGNLKLGTATLTAHLSEDLATPHKRWGGVRCNGCHEAGREERRRRQSSRQLEAGQQEAGGRQLEHSDDDC